MNIIIAILVFGVIIAIHEFGHFFVAKSCGVKVNEFALGMGPKILSWGKGETKYSLRLLPVGGYCSMEGEDDSSDDDRAFRKKKVWQRILIVSAGAIMNIFLGYILLIGITASQSTIITTQVAQFAENAVSEQTGLQVGDKIISVNGKKVYSDMDLSYQFQVDEDGIFDMTVVRNGEKVNLEGVTFEKITENGESRLKIDFYVEAAEKNIGSVISYATGKTVSVARMTWMTLGDMLSGKYKINDLSGPVGIVGAIGDAVESGDSIKEALQNVLSLAVFITINVGIFNLLPLPALDGGRLVFLIIEGIRRKPIKAEYEGMVHFVGLALLLLLVLVVSFNDIMKIFSN